MRSLHRLGYVVAAMVMFGACAADPQQVCKDGLSRHFVAFELSKRMDGAKTPADMQSVLAQFQSLADSAVTEGCSSQVNFAVNELRAALTEMRAATTDGQMFVHGLFSLFDAGDSSPMTQRGRAAEQRLNAAMELLGKEGIQGLK